MLNGLRRPQRYAVFISGSGSTLQSLLEMQHQIEISLVVSNKASAAGLLKAKRFGRPIIIVQNPIDYQELHRQLVHSKIERIILAGFMKLIPADFVAKWEGRIVNIHPSLLPLYPGLDSALKSWQDQSDMGVSIHYVNDQMDQGQIVLQQRSRKAPFEVGIGFDHHEVFLRRTEQHLLRELALRWK